MTKDPVCCLSTETVHFAAQVMKEQDIGVVLVVENVSEKHLVGVITDRDLVMKVLADERDPRDVSVGEVMSREIVGCSPDDDCQEALRLMEEHRIRRIPAVDRSGRVVGIISQGDVALRMHEPAKTAELVTEVSRPGHV
jgi:CBS domain-containing protein